MDTDPSSVGEADRDGSEPSSETSDDAQTPHDGGGSSIEPPGADSGMSPSVPAVPPSDHCAVTDDWDPKYVQLEEEVLALVNNARAAGHDCGSQGKFGPTQPLTMESRLRCAARLHSKYMGETKDYGHVTKGGVNFDQRIKEAGYPFATASENIAAGARSAAEVMNLWLDSDGHCRNIMWPEFTQIGIGHATDNADDPYFGPYPYWTQNFGRPL